MTIVAMIINVVNVNMASKISEYFSGNNREQLIRTLKNASRLIFIFTLPFTFIICFFPTYILSFFGEEYIIAKNSLIILIVGQGICSFFGMAPVYLNMTGRQHVFQIILIGSVIINFFLNRLLIPYHGLTGAAFAFSTSMIFWNFTSALFIYYKDKIIVFLN
ncbi:polysaccharide biosynthesis C-terminal domain-containing protein [Flavobacterium myungsuense]